MRSLKARVRQRALVTLGAPTGRLARDDDFDEAFKALHRRVAPYTMTTPERIYGLVEACDYVLRERVAGDFVECGVWKGGSSMVMALALQGAEENDRQLWLFDTFEGVPEPQSQDGELAQWHWQEHLRTGDPLAMSPLEEVRRNLASTGFPSDRTTFVRGKVEDTIPEEAPDQIAVLRLDTDWYSSTRHELDHFWDRIAVGGVLIIDDYGHFEGARQATDEFFADRGFRPLLHRLDYTGRLIVKTSGA